ncbi:MAG: hypothetical protein DRP11_05090 [Candidatus Aenigmatarchaeota archaeon]|nr:MAG: hypothetical protein DRP11_05090 [Candidatus Aenigmarchaeota archaeon]
MFHRIDESIKISSLRKELFEVYLNLSLTNVAMSLVGIFIPIYLLQLGYALADVLLYFLVMFGAMLILSLPSSYLISRIGFKHSITLSTPLLILQLVLLNLLEVWDINIYLIAVISGIRNIIYWLALNSDFASNTHKKRRGRETSYLFGFDKAAGIFGPIIGAVVITYFSFGVLFTISILILIGSIFPLFLTDDKRDPLSYSWRQVFSRRNWSFAVRFMAEGGFDVAGMLYWSLFVFLVLRDFMDIGWVGTLGALGSLILMLLIGRATDRFNRKNIMRTGAILYAILWSVRSITNDPLTAMLFSFLGGVFYNTINIPFFTIVNDKALDEDVMEFMTFREVFLCLGRIISLSLVLLLSQNLVFGFWIAGVAALVFLL